MKLNLFHTLIAPKTSSVTRLISSFQILPFRFAKGLFLGIDIKRIHFFIVILKPRADGGMKK
jgi:hypothetical protein